MLVRNMANQHFILPLGESVFVGFVVLNFGDLIRSQLIPRCYEHITLDKVYDGDMLAKALQFSTSFPVRVRLRLVDMLTSIWSV
jgi:hypothetical protein